MGNIFVETFSVPTGPVAQCLGYYFRSGSLSVSPFRFLAESYWLSPNKFYFLFLMYLYYIITFHKSQDFLIEILHTRQRTIIQQHLHHAEHS